MKQRPPRTPRFDLTEVILVSMLAAFMAWWGATQWTSRALASSDWEVDALAERYGPDRHSQYAEEWIIRDFFGDTRDGTFVDIGAGHHKNHSNTFNLETELGWSGLAIDAQSVFADTYRTLCLAPKPDVQHLFEGVGGLMVAILTWPHCASEDHEYPARSIHDSEDSGISPNPRRSSTV